METNASITGINQKWRLCTFLSLSGCLILVLCIKYQSSVIPSQSSFQSATSMTEAATTLAISEDFGNTVTSMNYNGNEHQNVSSSEFVSAYNGTDDDDRWLPLKELKKECNIYDGRWVYDPKTSPQYNTSQCPFLSDQVSCRKNGRPDFDYENWRWEALDCKIPSWNGKETLEKLRGKRMIIVGDSLNRNQWESLSCLLYSSMPSTGAFIDIRNGRHMIFKAKDYNCSVEFYWSPFLVELEDNTRLKNVKLLNLDTLSATSVQWLGADIMVFNTGHWWTHRGKLQAWDAFQHEGMVVQNLEAEIAFEMAMKTWAYWIDLNVDSAKTTVIFRSISPEHKREQWCYNQTRPIEDDSYISSFPRCITKIVEKTIGEMRTPVKYLNITKLSQYRKDAHPTVYTTKQGRLLTKEQREKPEYSDCNHWCLPGLPDTWNSLLFTSILMDASRHIS